MILKMILNTMGIILTLVINTVNTILPTNNLNTSLGDIITSMLSITQQALNFMYFIFGETLIVVVPVAITLIILKFTVVPVLMIIRSKFFNSTV